MVRINEFALHIVEVAAKTADNCGLQECKVEPKLLLNFLSDFAALRRENEALRAALAAAKQPRTKIATSRWDSQRNKKD